MNKHLVMLRTVTAFFISGLVCPTLNAAEIQKIRDSNITYEEVGDKYISSFGIVETEKPKELNQDPKAKLDLSVPVLSNHEKRCLIFGIMSSYEAQNPLTVANSLISNALRITVQDLDVLYGSGKDSQKSIINEINNTLTIFGDVALAYGLAHPLNKEAIEKRQALIQELITNEDFAKQVESLLDGVKNAESGFLSFWHENDPISAKFLKDLYFSKPGFKKWNTNPYALEASVRAGNLGTACKLGGDLALLVAANYLILKGSGAIAKKMDLKDTTGRPVEIHDSFVDALKNTGKLIKSCIDPRDYIDTLKNVDSEIAKAAAEMAQAGNTMSDLQKNFFKKTIYGITAFKAILTIAAIFYKTHSVKGAIEQATQTKDSINYLQTRLIDVATIVNTCKKLSELSKINTILNGGLVSINAIDQLFNGETHTDDFMQLINLLQTPTFEKHASFFSLSGRVLAANRLMIDEKAQFASVLAVLGELDSCLSMAKLYKKMQHARVGYCFVQFTKEDQPLLDLVDFWNPLVDVQRVVTNSLKLGTNADASKIILTGSNTGGKSTLLKGIMTNLLLAHTFGMAPATSCVLSFFDFLGSYLRVNDDTPAGESKFKAEVLRTKLLCEAMDSLLEDQFGFVVIDELFTGTGSSNAAKAAAKVAQKLADKRNNLYILATHFPSLTELEPLNLGIIKNYKVDVFTDEQGNLIRPYKLEEGISTNNIANQILNEQIQDIDFSI